MTDAENPTLTIPHDALVVLCGPAASGKSTFAARCFAPTQIVASDRCRAMICDDPANQAVSGRAFDLLYCIIRHRLDIRRLTVADSTALDRPLRRQLLRVARDCGRPAVIIVFNVPVEVCLERDAARARQVGREVIERHAAKLSAALENLAAEGFDRVYVLRRLRQKSECGLHFGGPRSVVAILCTRTPAAHRGRDGARPSEHFCRRRLLSADQVERVRVVVGDDAAQGRLLPAAGEGQSPSDRAASATEPGRSRVDCGGDE